MRLILLLLPLLTSLSVYAQRYDCRISHTMITHEAELNSTWHVFIKNNSGIIKLDGILYNGKKNNSIISRQIFFSVETFGEQGYHFTSQRIKKNPAENITSEDIAKYFPDFFIDENKKTMFTITSTGKGYIMSWATDPMFFCY